MGHLPRVRQAAEKGPAARRRPKAAREAYFLYVERADEGANEADGPLSARERHVPDGRVEGHVVHDLEPAAREEGKAEAGGSYGQARESRTERLRDTAHRACHRDRARALLANALLWMATLVVIIYAPVWNPAWGR